MPSAKLSARRDQACNQIPFTREVVEVPRVKQDSCIAQQRNRKVLVRPEHGHAQDGVPSSLDGQTLTQVLRSQFGVEFGEIRHESACMS